ncbi:hypothetical protein TVAG_344260 [Trichomonas vaginalis G3]|uniref:SCP domain-containing protein n=1 Tax=Trichomonas vaginalis (strain ATCC PRA-98 / G3) TaxID=412133 RepID=A2E7P7_TRIV3|nr:hypothetical protein TVAGG3_0598590 [Trichomonas vaginalis G3]EAY11332.1 hypothetical protein TVAG_344260 [Trichomonas vaginalis G3]KAI5523775.1 hypothetical protein TVAGG3_0598590 [Trichomonas vaginalis G3]|eukprot:XP_001323555.1 hypothetical protein [Trichomonas vaginalis G3]
MSLFILALTSYNHSKYNLRSEVCSRFQTDFLVEDYATYYPTLSRSADNCAIPQYDETTDSTNALKVLNYLRYLNGLQDTSIDNSKREDVCKCAAYMLQNNDVSHTPSSSKKCYSSEAYTGCSKSNLNRLQFKATSATSVMYYYWDEGVSTLGHRLHVTRQNLLKTTFCGAIYDEQGSTYQAMGVNLYRGISQKNPNIIAVPPPGPVPLHILQYQSFAGHKSGNWLTWFSVSGQNYDKDKPGKVEVWNDFKKLDISYETLEKQLNIYYTTKYKFNSGGFESNKLYWIKYTNGDYEYRYWTYPTDCDFQVADSEIDRLLQLQPECMMDGCERPFDPPIQPDNPDVNKTTDNNSTNNNNNPDPANPNNLFA